MNDRDYYCRSRIDNVVFLAHVDKEFRDEIADEFLAGMSGQDNAAKGACRFMRKKAGGAGTVCAIYSSRPKVCRSFTCYKMVIRNSEGKACGRVIGRNTLRSENPHLLDIWTREIEPLPHGDPAAWAARVTAVLAGHKYHAENVE